MRLVDSESDTSVENVVEYEPPPVPQSGPRAEKISACLLAFDVFIAVVSAILVLADMLLYMSFYYEMAQLRSRTPPLLAFSLLLDLLFLRYLH